VSLPPELWAALRLESDVVRERANFFTAYARSEAPLFEADSLIRALRDGPIATGEQAVVSLFRAEQTGPVVELRQRISDSGERSQRPTWVRVAERADALRQSAMAQLLFDTQAGRNALLRSAAEYRRLGLPFGPFLTAAATGSRDDAFEAGRRLAFVLNPELPLEPDEESIIPLAHTLDAATQQVAVLMTAMSLADAIYEFRITSDVLASAVQAGGSAPVGTTAQPIALWWECGSRLADLAFGRARARGDLRTLIVELAGAHGTELRNAQYDGFHWPVAAARVDLVDLNLAGIVAISARLLRQLREPYWDMLEDFDNLSPLSQISIQIGLDLAGQDGERPEVDPSLHPQPGPTFGPQADSGQSSTIFF
jgi:hypothetical protein